MKIALLEPIGVSKEVIDELSVPITEKGHESYIMIPKQQIRQNLPREVKAATLL